MQVSLNVASHEIRGVHQICGADGMIAETQMRAGESTRLLGVVGEICLAILVGVVTDDLDRVLVGTYRSVSAKTEELGLEHTRAVEIELGKQRQRHAGHVILDADCKLVSRLVKLEVLVYSEHLGRSSILRAETISAAYDYRSILAAIEAVFHIKIERLAGSSRLLCAVEHSDLLRRRGHAGEEMLGREGAVEVYADDTDLLPFSSEIVHSLAGSLRDAAHGDDHALSLRISIVIEKMVFAAGDFGNLGHILLHNLGNSRIV